MDENGAESTEELHFFYDAQSKPAFVEYDGVMYRYVHNLQGDIVAIVDTDGNLVVEYKYDAWGYPIEGSSQIGIGVINPFRYRRYIWDKEVNLYYLKSRYYDACFHRFINLDDFGGRRGDVLSHNLFSYCDNRSIICDDVTGHGKTYVFYYYFPESASPLKAEAMNSPYFDATDSDNVEMIPVKTARDFINSWNAMEGEIDDIYLYLHGAPGCFVFAADMLGIDDSFEHSLEDALQQKIVNGTVYDFACYGAAKKNGKSVAEVLASKTQASVIACDVGVSYRFEQDILKSIYKDTWHARTRTIFMFWGSHWYRFIYNKTTNKIKEVGLNIWRVIIK